MIRSIAARPRRLRDAPDLERDGDVVGDRPPRQQRLVLGHVPDARVDLVDERPVVADRPARGLHETAHHVEQRRLAAAARADQRHELPLGHREGCLVERLDLAEALAEVGDLDHACEITVAVVGRKPVLVGACTTMVVPSSESGAAGPRCVAGLPPRLATSPRRLSSWSWDPTPRRRSRSPSAPVGGDGCRSRSQGSS